MNWYVIACPRVTNRIPRTPNFWLLERHYAVACIARGCEPVAEGLAPDCSILLRITTSSPNLTPMSPTSIGTLGTPVPSSRNLQATDILKINNSQSCMAVYVSTWLCRASSFQYQLTAASSKTGRNPPRILKNVMTERVGCLDVFSLHLHINFEDHSALIRTWLESVSKRHRNTANGRFLRMQVGDLLDRSLRGEVQGASGQFHQPVSRQNHNPCCTNIQKTWWTKRGQRTCPVFDVMRNHT